MAKTTTIGRPPKLTPDEQTLGILEGLGRIQATTKETAAVLRVSEVTLIAFLKRHIKAREVYEMGKDTGRTSLRRAQWKLAEAGNATMMIWLGKQWLDQKDRVSNELSGDASFIQMLKVVSGERA